MAQQKGFKRAQKVAARKARTRKDAKAAILRREERVLELAVQEAEKAAKAAKKKK